MKVSAMYIPKSKKGLAVGHLLRKRGYDIRNDEVVGRYVMNLDCAHELNWGDLRAIAYVLDPEGAMTTEEWAMKQAEDILHRPEAYGLTAEQAELEAEYAAKRWVY
jgi:hypothetical protein